MAQFNDFIMKIDAELSRRNRLKVEVYSRLDEQDEQLSWMRSEVERFGVNQKKVLSTVKKLMYTSDIQSSINIQDELDREWVSLFAAIDERTGGRQV